jgi:uncharacterized protein (DUF1778 family)
MPITRRKRQIEGQKNDKRVAPRFSAEEKALIEAAALKQRQTVSAFIGEVMIGEAEKVLGITLEEFERIHLHKK